MESTAVNTEIEDKAVIKVNVEVMSWLKEDFNHEGWDKLVFSENIAPGSSILDLLHLLAKKYPRFGHKAFRDAGGALFDYCAVILNGTFLSSANELNTELKEGDSIKLTPGFYGG